MSLRHSLPLSVVYCCALSCGNAPSASPATGGAEAHAGATSLGGGTTAGAAGALTASGGETSDNSAGTTNGGANTAGAPSGGASVGGGTSAGSGGASAGAAGSESIPVPAGYKLVWHDEFDIDGAPSAANYNFERGFQRNEEAQWYQADNASIAGGLLVIEARKETVQNPNYTGSGDWKTTRKTAEYTSSSVTTSGKQSFQYGHFEMRARIPTDSGMWPAWWTLGVKGQWPSNGEIDIMEYYKGNVLANVACGTATAYQAKWDSTATPLTSLGASWAAQFHVWTMDWDEQSIALSVDGKVLNTSTLSSMLNADGTSPFKQKAYLLVNLAIGGMNGGDPSKTTFPKRYEIDYLRVFQKE